MPAPNYHKHNNKMSTWSFVGIFVLFICIMFIIYSKTISTSPTRFTVTDVSAQKTKRNNIELLSRFQLSLSSTAYDAINHGVPIDIVLTYAEPKTLLWWKRYNVLGKTIYRISRHALSSNYQLKNLSTFQTYQFVTIDEALKHIAIFQLKNLKENSSNNIAVRIHLDIYNLPAQIRASAFFSSRWRHDSYWTIWEVS